MNYLPMAHTVPRGVDKSKVIAAAHRKFSGALANDTKWNELLTFMRELEGWRPSYRSKWVNGYISEWDAEWFYHLPFPFVGVEWLDISLNSRTADHSKLILGKLSEIGFEFEAKGDVARIWGYAPKSYEDFPPKISAS